MSKKLDIRDLLNEINKILSFFIENNIAIDQNFPKIITGSNEVSRLTFEKSTDSSSVMRNLPYDKIYNQIIENRDFSIRLLDNSVVQMEYIFERKKIAKHRLSFYPCPYLQNYQENPDIFEVESVYSEMYEGYVVPSPIRFDYDPSAFEEDIHPSSHVTFGQYRNCRVPVYAPISPYLFLEFLVRAFYNDYHSLFKEKIPKSIVKFPKSIKKKEMEKIFICGP